MLTRAQADEKVRSLIKNQNLYKHCLAVEAAMREYAQHFNRSEAEIERWGIAGLIHDADWEAYPDKHPNVTLSWLNEVGESDELQNAVASHGFSFNVEAKTLMAKTLRSVDELTGLIVAVALVKGGKLSEVTQESVLKKWGVTGFAKGVKREEIDRGASEIGKTREDHVVIVLRALKGITSQLGFK